MMKNKILIVDDDELLVKAYRDKLEKENYQIDEASDGEAGLKSALEKHPDMILLDINLPKMNGVEVMEKLREDDWGRTVPIIIISNLDADDERIKSITRNEPAYYLLKRNYTLDDLVTKIKEVLK